MEEVMKGTPVAPAELLERARSISTLIEAEADTVERETRITRKLHDALVETELYWIALPRELGGAETDLVTCIEVIEEIARADGSTGWSYFVNLVTTAGVVPFVTGEALTILFANGARPIAAGQLVPPPNARSLKVEGGYVCSGQHSFASGSAFANWITSTQFEHDGDTPLLNDDGSPRMTITLMRPEDVTFKGNWDVMGMVGTSSYDYEVKDVFVPDAMMIEGILLSPDSGQRGKRGHTLLRLGSLLVGVAGHTACVLGIMKRGMQELVALVAKKSRLGYQGTIAQDPVFLNRFAHFDAEYHAVRGRVLEVFRDIEERVAGGGAVTEEDFARARQTSTWAHEKAGEIVGFCFRWSGTTPVRNPNVLGRCMRDLLVANAHLLFDSKTMTDAGPSLVRSWSDSPD
jgi:alkylation response protein AidB-like acyl-CoA dehydrogenase